MSKISSIYFLLSKTLFSNLRYQLKLYNELLKREFSWCSGVIYWPSTEPSIKRCTSVNKQRKQVDARQLYSYVPQTAWVSSGWSWSQLGTRCRIESHDWAAPASMGEKCCCGQKNFGSIYKQSVSVSISPLTHNQHQPFRE